MAEKNRIVDKILLRILGLLPIHEVESFIEKLICKRAMELLPENSLRFLFRMETFIYKLQGQKSMEYGGGIHTKHRHMNYHQFFINNLRQRERVLDIGSGNGFLAYDMASNVEGVKVVGIELNDSNIRFARQRYNHPCVEFIHGDALEALPDEKFDVVTLSNVLEHIEHRVEFLNEVIEKIRPKRLILRVPMFERDWRVPLRKELNVDYFLDETHCIEYTQEEFFGELAQAGLEVVSAEFRWGEIWCVSRPRKRSTNV